jgi:methionyl-tRNA formyltransferase
MDAELDHGDIIVQKEVPVHAWDTSLDAYERVRAAENELLERSIDDILAGTYRTTPPREEGVVNRKKDFEALREIHLDEKVTFRQAIDRLRALTHGAFRNAYFYDPVTKKKVGVRITLELEDSESSVNERPG